MRRAISTYHRNALGHRKRIPMIGDPPQSPIYRKQNEDIYQQNMEHKMQFNWMEMIQIFQAVLQALSTITGHGKTNAQAIAEVTAHLTPGQPNSETLS